MILAGDATGTDLAMAAQLAQALGHLIDEVVIQERSFDDLVNLVPARFADHWQKVLQFLSIVTQAWPAILAERGAIDAADRRGRLLKALTKRLGQRAPVRPMIIAGSTGSIPASAALMAQVARLENGMVILPGLDQDLDAPSFDQLEPGHPQWGMAQTLQRMGATRADVRWFGQTDGASKRAGLLSEALRPAATTELWRDARLRLGAVMTAAIDGLSIIIAPSEVEEASIIALALREALETPDKTAALVTPDRALARRVGAELARWRIKVDDSAGRPLSKTAIGIAFQLVLDVVQDFAPASILSLLKNPLCTLGQDRTSLTDAVARLEISALRGLRLKSGFAALIDAAEDGPARRLVERLADALAPLCALADQPALLGTWISAHCAALEHVSGASSDNGEIDVWHGDAGEALLALLAELVQAKARSSSHCIALRIFGKGSC
jgi:ATP-dependent helicase/nuclease subunit B